MTRNKSSASGPGVYIHIPYCLSKCAYCSFRSAPVATGFDFGPYIEAVRRHLHLQWNQINSRKIEFSSLFIGGGTPTIVPARLLAGLIEDVLASLPFTNQPEVTVEANPNTIDIENLTTLSQAGVNRLSIGVQSFNDRRLAAIGRTHTADQARQAFDSAVKAGFANINLDLIAGLPGQTVSEWQNTLEAATTLQPQHLSIYDLMIEEPSLFANRLKQRNLVLPEENELSIMDELTAELTAEHGFKRYEISNYARDGLFCRQNLNYWHNGDYLGLGAGAVGYIDGIRRSNEPDPQRYIGMLAEDTFPDTAKECLTLEARFRETVIMGLRMISGINVRELEERFGISLVDYYGPKLNSLLARNLLRFEAGFLTLTPQGLLFANLVMAELV